MDRDLTELKDMILSEVNLATWQPSEFIYEGIPCTSIVSVLEALRVNDSNTQKTICKKTAVAALRSVKPFIARNGAVKNVYWQGSPYPRDSQQCADIHTRLFDAVFEQDETFRDNLLSTCGSELPPIVGNNSQAHSMICIAEIAAQLYRLRSAFES